MSSNYIAQLYKSRGNLLYYLNDLGYDVSDHVNFTVDEISAKYSESTNDQISLLNMDNIQHQEREESVSVMYYLKSRPSNIEQMSHNFFSSISSNDDEKEKHTLIIIVNASPNDTMIKSLKRLWHRYHEYVVVLDIPFLQLNILKHEYVPKHEKLMEDGKRELYEKYNIVHDTQLPEISMMDPVARVILLRPSQVCRITRYDKISFKNYYYRICVA